MKVIAAFLLT